MPSNTPGLGKERGDNDHREYVGGSHKYDYIAAMVFNLLTCIGLRQHHRVLDIGCGSLRVGRLLIPYLNSNNYFGVEPNGWLVEAGIANEIGADLVAIKKPTFSFRASLEEFGAPLNIDFAVAHGIFIHCGIDVIESWLSQVVAHLKDDGVLIATFFLGDDDFQYSGWVSPVCTVYKLATVEELATKFDFRFRAINWEHQCQTWCALAKPGADTTLLEGNPITWNRFAEKFGASSGKDGGRGRVAQPRG